MFSVSSQARIWVLIAIAIMAQTASAQKGSAGGGRTTPPARTPSNDTATQPLFISGRVALDGGAALAEPVAIERVCNGSVRREGYTDFKGNFQLQIGTPSVGFQDASEGDTRSAPTASMRTNGPTINAQHSVLEGCELRAVLAGFQSTSVILRPSLGDNFQIDVGTIMLKRMGDVKGTAISVTSMAAPKDARQAFEKANKAFSEDKLPEAHKELEKAVRIYSQYAAAWSKLGDVDHRLQNIAGAKKAYEKALEVDPQYVNPVYGLALIAVVEKNWKDAAQLTAQVNSMNRFAFPSAAYYNAAANYNLGNYEVAEESARKFKTSDTAHQHPEVSLLLSSILAQKRDFTGAAQQIRDYLAIVPNSAKTGELEAQARTFEQQSLANTR
jgi:tetratricopeptide (TPR) repeat protein